MESECDSVGVFLLGDPLSSEIKRFSSDFVLNRQSLLRNQYGNPWIEMLYRNEVTENADGKHLPVESLTFSLTGETIYMIVSSADSINRIMAWEVSNWKLKAEKEVSIAYFVKGGHVLAVSGGVLIATSRTLELWNFELSYCIRKWSLVVISIFAISDDQVLCTKSLSAEEIIVDTVTGDIVSTFAVSSYKSISCYRNLHLLSNTDVEQTGCIKLQQLGESVPRWKLNVIDSDVTHLLGRFSPKGQYIVVVGLSKMLVQVLDVFSGSVRFNLSDVDCIYDFKFISDEEFVILDYYSSHDACLRLFSARSGNMLSVMHVYSCDDRSSLATCPGEGLIAISSRIKYKLKIIKVKLSEEKRCVRNGKKVSWKIVYNHF